MKPGAIFAGWLVGAGLVRTFIEFFRPDQPRIGDTFVTTSMLVSCLMAIAGFVMLMIRYQKLQPAFAENWEEDYSIADPYGEEEEKEEKEEKKEEQPVRSKRRAAKVESDKQEAEPVADVIEEKPAKKRSTRKTAEAKPKPVSKTKRVKKKE
jgi:hypothetical protein